MSEEQLENLKQSVLKQMRQAYKEEGMERILKMIISFHSCEGAAYYNIHDYLHQFDY